MQPVEICKNIFWIGVNDDRTELFEGLWPIKQEGISYNSYLIKGAKTVLIDLCKDLFQEKYLASLKTLTDPSKIDYLVVNHMEPDHSGALRAFREVAPQAVILTTQKAVKMLVDFFGIKEAVRVVADGETLDLGSHQLKFITAPMVHWPETMMTCETSTGILFSCDAFGGFGKLTNGIFDEDYSDLSFYEKESLRYYANIVAAFSKPVLNAGEKLAGLNISMVAPSHGLVWRKDPSRIIKLYLQWSEYGKGKAQKGVTLLHSSMYGNTGRMALSVRKGLEEAGIPLDVFDVTATHPSYILPSLWVNQGVAIGAPTYEGSLFPTMAQVLSMAEFKRVFHKDAIYFGSFGWGGGATRYLNAQFEKMKWQLLETLEFPGEPKPETLVQAVEFGKRFGERIKSL
ncbi:MAG: FprA family A-type flavoprotein [Pelolinea sp.]|nr:FprA family A-type flavoprotein [Pelolinea sp.]